MNIKKITRRDFLKAASLLSLSTLTSFSHYKPKFGDERKNIVIILFDAMSALNLSLYGYSRNTTPELAKFSDRSNVYNAHYSASNFTSSGTASMLTGMLPWKHRAITQGSFISSKLSQYNMYSLLGDQYLRLAFSQNFWPDRLIGQFYKDVDRFLPQTKYSYRGNTLLQSWMGKDRALASIAFDDFLFPAQVDRSGSSLLGYFYKSKVAAAYEAQRWEPGYRSGTPEVSGYFAYQNDVILQGVQSEIIDLHNTTQPYYAYFHLFSPHAPYRPSNNFRKLFVDDNYQYPDKLANPKFRSFFRESKDNILEKRLAYDQQIAHLDDEFGKVIRRLNEEGVLDNSYVIVTSDHGEMFERGFIGHGGIMMYEPNIRIPLIIHKPGQTSRKDINVPTSNIDLLPSLLSIAEKPIPDQLEGKVLPGFGVDEDPNRPIFSVFAWENSAFLPITKAAIAMRKNNYKLIVYLGYEESGETVYELYDLENDPEELSDLSGKNLPVFDALKEEFFVHLAYANENYLPR